MLNPTSRRAKGILHVIKKGVNVPLILRESGGAHHEFTAWCDGDGLAQLGAVNRATGAVRDLRIDTEIPVRVGGTTFVRATNRREAIYIQLGSNDRLDGIREPNRRRD